ncbi:MAG: hypothetical protein KAJ58_01735 [Candidatus Pacebacteria bacterium]|nr:hypothetical protein [Candidatus Paceibacterota bacterium]
MNKTSFKFISGFVFILIVSLGVLVYISGSSDLKEDINPIENLAAEQA